MMILPPGAFLVTGLILVAKRMIDERSSKAVPVSAAHCAP
jgi:electron transport complex protein RnfE